MHAKSLQSCLTLCDPIEPARLLYPWGFSRILERVAMPSFRGSSPPRLNLCLLWLLHCRQILYR